MRGLLVSLTLCIWSLIFSQDLNYSPYIPSIWWENDGNIDSFFLSKHLNLDSFRAIPKEERLLTKKPDLVTNNGDLSSYFMDNIRINSFLDCSKVNCMVAIDTSGNVIDVVNKNANSTDCEILFMEIKRMLLTTKWEPGSIRQYTVACFHPIAIIMDTF